MGGMQFETAVPDARAIRDPEIVRIPSPADPNENWDPYLNFDSLPDVRSEAWMPACAGIFDTNRPTNHPDALSA